MSEKFIFLHGLSVRSGTNFMARLMMRHPDIEIIPRRESTQEFPLLFNIRAYYTAHKQFVNTYNGNPDDYKWTRFAPYLGEAFTKFIYNELSLEKKPEKKIFIKDPRIENIGQFFALFPKAKLIILLRDGRDLIASGEKGYMAKHKHHSRLERVKRQFNYRTGRMFKIYVKAWMRKVEELKTFLEKEGSNQQVLVTQFERIQAGDLKEIKRLFEFCELSCDHPEIFTNIEIIGSSFSDELMKGAQKTVWKPLKNIKNFKPVGRWRQWPEWKKRYFHQRAGALLKELGYTTDEKP